MADSGWRIGSERSATPVVGRLSAIRVSPVSYPIGILPPKARISLLNPPAFVIDFMTFCICR